MGGGRVGVQVYKWMIISSFIWTSITAYDSTVQSLNVFGFAVKRYYDISLNRIHRRKGL